MSKKAPAVLAPEPDIFMVKKVSMRSVAELIPYARNARTHSAAQVEQIARSIKRFGFLNPVLVRGDDVVAGHGRIMAAQHLGLQQVPTIPADHLNEAERRAFILADNRLAELAGWDMDLLRLELGELADMEDLDLQDAGFAEDVLDDLLGDNEENPVEEAKGSLNEQFGVPPFSVLDTRKGYWVERRRNWQRLICDKGESRQGTLASGDGNIVAGINSGVSILDAVMAEMMVRWFGKARWTAFDPFAGDSVFGYVACHCGMKFKGIELRQEQANLNQQRLDKDKLDGLYYCDTAENMDKYIPDESVDLVFSCPPYADLEVYSDDPRDISNMPHDQFFNVLRTCLQKTYQKLKKDRFAVIVVSEVRNKKGLFIGLVPQVIQFMQEAGYSFYNEIVLVNSVGTLAQRAGRQMNASRKVGRMHQNILVFYKGDPKAIKQNFGDVVVTEEPDEEETE